MLNEIKEFDFFINNAKPDYAQAQILYRLVRQWNKGTVISIGSAVLNKMPQWDDTFLLEYVTQKHALDHAHRVLTPVTNCKLILVNPSHLGDITDEYAKQCLESVGI
jgi:hypothetical protein